MSQANILETFISVAYFVAVAAGAHREVLSITETKMLFAIGVVGVILITFLTAGGAVT